MLVPSQVGSKVPADSDALFRRVLTTALELFSTVAVTLAATDRKVWDVVVVLEKPSSKNGKK